LTLPPGLLLLALDVGLFLVVTLDFLSSFPLLVLDTLVGGASGLHAQFLTLAGGLLGQVFRIRLGLVGLFLGSSKFTSLKRRLRRVLLSPGDGFTSFLVIPFGVALVRSPALANLLLRVAKS
jgi:hypothetical protein